MNFLVYLLLIHKLVVMKMYTFHLLVLSLYEYNILFFAQKILLSMLKYVLHE